MTITLKCPACGNEVMVNSAVGLEEKTTSCPKCQTISKIGEFIPKCCLKVDGKNYQLHFGRQWVGREKEGNDAEVQIPEGEKRYMSKKHAIIELSCSQRGIDCTFEEHGKNATNVQGIDLMKDDIIYLAKDTCLTMGSKKMYLAYEYEK